MSYSEILKNLNLKIYADGADFQTMEIYSTNEIINGFTTNPTLMRNSGVTNYKEFALSLLKIIKDKPISFEVFADDIDEMYKQAKIISSWGDNVKIKIPVTNTKSEDTSDLISSLVSEGVELNVTAIFTMKQVENILRKINDNSNVILSIFAGRIADTGKDPMEIIKNSVNLSNSYNSVEILWASPRELLNIFQAESIGCHIITLAPDILKKINLINKNLEEYSLETVKMFFSDALKSNYKI